MSTPQRAQYLDGQIRMLRTAMEQGRILPNEMASTRAALDNMTIELRQLTQNIGVYGGQPNGYPAPSYGGYPPSYPMQQPYNYQQPYMPPAEQQATNIGVDRYSVHSSTTTQQPQADYTSGSHVVSSKRIIVDNSEVSSIPLLEYNTILLNTKEKDMSADETVAIHKLTTEEVETTIANSLSDISNILPYFMGLEKNGSPNTMYDLKYYTAIAVHPDIDKSKYSEIINTKSCDFKSINDIISILYTRDEMHSFALGVNKMLNKYLQELYSCVIQDDILMVRNIKAINVATFDKVIAALLDKDISIETRDHVRKAVDGIKTYFKNTADTVKDIIATPNKTNSIMNIEHTISVLYIGSKTIVNAINNIKLTQDKFYLTEDSFKELYALIADAMSIGHSGRYLNKIIVTGEFNTFTELYAYKVADNKFLLKIKG